MHSPEVGRSWRILGTEWRPARQVPRERVGWSAGLGQVISFGE